MLQKTLDFSEQFQAKVDKHDLQKSGSNNQAILGKINDCLV